MEVIKTHCAMCDKKYKTEYNFLAENSIIQVRKKYYICKKCKEKYKTC